MKYVTELTPIVLFVEAMTRKKTKDCMNNTFKIWKMSILTTYNSNNNMDELKPIKLTVIPVIEHDLITVGKMVDERLSALNLANLIATEDTISSMKKLSAELNSEFKEFEEQRKVVKDLVMKPYNDMDVIYKQSVTEKYKNAAETLKLKIDEFEDKVKSDKKAELESYFNELCVAEKIDFLKFEHTKIEVNLSTSLKKYKEEVLDFITRVKSDLELISVQQHETEMLVEYKKDLNASRAIKAVLDRKEQERIEAETARLKEQERRQQILVIECNMLHRDFVKAYANILDETIVITDEFINTATKEEFGAKILDIKSKIELQKQANNARPQSISIKEAVSPQPLQSPTVVVEQPQVEILIAKFSVSGTMAQLTALNNYMKENGLQYENIK